MTWFEEPVSSGDLDGLRFVRERAPLDVAAGEYAYVAADFRNLLGGVDCLQADVTRCGGVTGLIRVGASRKRTRLPLSGHCAPAASMHVLCAAPTLRHLEWFHDHVRIERMFFDGFAGAQNGELRPDARDRPRARAAAQDADRYAGS